jgi:hypothetical protein
MRRLCVLINPKKQLNFSALGVGRQGGLVGRGVFWNLDRASEILYNTGRGGHLKEILKGTENRPLCPGGASFLPASLREFGGRYFEAYLELTDTK